MLAYKQGDQTACLGSSEKMVRFLLSQYTTKKNNNPNNCDKKGDKNKKDDNPKSEDKSVENTDITGAHVGETTSNKYKICAPSASSSIGVHITDVTKTVVRPPQCVQDIFLAHSIVDLI